MLFARVGESGFDQFAANAASFQRGRDAGAGEDDLAVAEMVIENGGMRADDNFKAAAFPVVGDDI